jgi:glycerol-3-phosphate dehydrogenase (NAD(P)+)
MTDVLREVIPGIPSVALSGPSFAHEVFARQPTAVVAASDSAAAATLVQQAFSSSYFRVYTSDDPLGVQLGGALKNVIAIAAGLLHGLRLGHNTLSAMITRGLAELTRLGQTMGAEARTFSGLAGPSASSWPRGGAWTRSSRAAARSRKVCGRRASRSSSARGPAWSCRSPRKSR